MNTLDDLRASLDQRAEQLHDTELYARPVAVRRRIRAVRRRRTAVAAVVAAAVVVGGVAGVGALRQPAGPEPAGRTLFGVDVPAQVSVSGWSYDLDRTERFSSDRARLRLDDGDTERAVALVGSDLGSGFATLFRDGEAVARVSGGQELAVPVPVATGAVTLRVQVDDAPADAHAGVAVYDRSDQLPAGVSNGTAVFRDTVAGAPLVRAAFAEPAETSVALTFDGRPDRLSFAGYCRTSAKGLWLNIELDGSGPFTTQCASDDADAGANGSQLDDSTPGRHTVTAYVTRGMKGPRVSVEGLGLGIYRTGGDADVLGAPVPRTVEADGRTWALDRVVMNDRTTVDTADGDRLLGFVADGADPVWASWEGRSVDGESTMIGSSVGAGWSDAGTLLQGDTYRVRLQNESGAAFRGALLVYRPL